MLVLIVALLVGLAGGFAAGGSLRNLERFGLRLPWLVLAAIGIQFLIFSPLAERLGDDVVVGAHLVSYGLLLLFAAFNIRRAGIALAGVGIFLNAVAIGLNHGYMPASTRALEIAGFAGQESVHNNSAVAGTGTRVMALGDVFAVPSGVPFANVFSIGDVFIALGVALLLAMAMRPALSAEPAG